MGQQIIKLLHLKKFRSQFGNTNDRAREHLLFVGGRKNDHFIKVPHFEILDDFKEPVFVHIVIALHLE